MCDDSDLIETKGRYTLEGCQSVGLRNVGWKSVDWLSVDWLSVNWKSVDWLSVGATLVAMFSANSRLKPLHGGKSDRQGAIWSDTVRRIRYRLLHLMSCLAGWLIVIH